MSEGATARARRRAALLTLGALLACVAVVVAVPDLRGLAGEALRGDLDALDVRLDSLGAEAALFLAVLMLAHAVVPYPAEIPPVAAGYVLGFAIAVPFCIALWLLCALATYALGRHLGRPAIARLIGAARAARMEARIGGGGARLLLIVRLTGLVPFAFIGYIAGAARVPLGRFSWTTVVGYAPRTVALVLLGSRLDSFRLDDPVLWLVPVPFVVGLLLAVLSRRKPPGAPGPSPVPAA